MIGNKYMAHDQDFQFMLYLEEPSEENTVWGIAKREICKPDCKIFGCNFLPFHLNAQLPAREILEVLTVLHFSAITNIKWSSIHALQESGSEHSHYSKI